MTSSRTALRRRTTVAVLGVASTAMLATFALAGPAGAAIVPTVPLATSAEYSVLAGSAVTNTGPSVLDASLGVAPGASITGFPPGIVNAPGTINDNNAAAGAAQADLTTAYVDAAGRPVDATTTADLAGLNLGPGVYSGPSKSPLGLTGPLVLDGGGDPTAVFIFQTDSTLITGSGSTVSLVNGAQECNVFWQVGSSATLGTGSTFTGNILALTSITVTTGVTVHGRALARNGAVTLDTDVFTSPTCDTTGAGTTTTTTDGGATTTTTDGGATTTTTDGGATTTTTDGGTTTTTGAGSGGSGGPADGTGTGTGTGPSGPDDQTPAGTHGVTGIERDLSSQGAGGPGVPGVNGPPKTDADPASTGSLPWSAVWLGGTATLVVGGSLLTRRSTRHGSTGRP